MFEIVARELRAKLLGRQRGLADTTQQHSATGVEGAGGTGGHGCGGRGRWRGQAGLRGDTPSHAQQHSTAGVEGAGGSGGPGRGAGGWRQGQGGPRDRPLRAAGSRVAISRAGRRPPAHTAAGPQSSTTERPEHQRRHTATTCSANGERAGRRPRAHQAARPDGAQNTSGAASTSGQVKRPYSPPPPGSGRPV